MQEHFITRECMLMKEMKLYIFKFNDKKKMCTSLAVSYTHLDVYKRQRILR